MSSVNLKKKTISGVRWTTLSSGIVVVTYLLQISILSRYLAKEDFGIVSIAMVVLGLAQAFVDMGFSNAIIYKQNATKIQLDTLYWLNIIAGFIIFSILWASSSAIAVFYNELALQNVLFWIAFNFVIQPFGIQFKVLLQKNLEFNTVSKIEIIGALSGFLVAIIWALISPSAYALVFSFLTTSFITTLLFLINGFKANPPSLQFNYGEVRDFMSFGMYQMGERIINYFNSQFDILLIGKILGAETLGVYSIAKQLILRPSQVINPIVTKVTFPVMAQMQNDIPQLREIYIKTINYLSSINFLIYTALFILAEPVVLLLFSDKWLDAVVILKILSVYGAIRSTGNPIGSLLLARGRARLGFFWNLGLFFIIPAIIYGGSRYGIEGVCYSLVILMTFLIIPNWYFQVKPLCHAGFVEYHMQIIKPALIAFITGCIGYLAILPIDNFIMKIIAASFAGFMSAFSLNYLFNKSFIKTILKLGRK